MLLISLHQKECWSLLYTVKRQANGSPLTHGQQKHGQHAFIVNFPSDVDILGCHEFNFLTVDAWILD